jgi:hypothetical protein
MFDLFDFEDLDDIFWILWKKKNKVKVGQRRRMVRPSLTRHCLKNITGV